MVIPLVFLKPNRTLKRSQRFISIELRFNQIYNNFYKRFSVFIPQLIIYNLINHIESYHLNLLFVKIQYKNQLNYISFLENIVLNWQFLYLRSQDGYAVFDINFDMP